MDQSRAPVLEALAAYRRRGDISFTPPGHKQGRGVDPRVLDVMGADLEAVAEAFAAAPDAKGVIVASPVDYGTCGDLEGIDEVCRRHDRTFIVDEAWGAHLPFHDNLPTWGMNAGADLAE
ncbi:hypothetical protein AB0C14_20390 [Microbispora hainanensis]|uniref:hypothetical protein n=1 Tax=Microbispora hainanensis TaxID=568844 RepID=UPI0033ED0A7B